VLSVLGTRDQVEARLAAGAVRCPGCDGSLARWGWARPRVVRTRTGARTVRPRRAWCAGCESTHVLLPASCVPLRRDSAEVIGAAALGAGHRRIAADLGRPAATVRGWLRRAHTRKDAIRASATRWAYALDPELGRVHPAGSRLGDAVEALALAARAWVLRFGPVRPWELAVHLTGGLLVRGRLRDPP
jgi:hypothetical protein